MWGCVKSLLPPSAAEFSFDERHIIFEISLHEISKMSNYLAGRALGNNILVCVHFLRAFASKKCTHTKKILRGEAADTTGK